jgi:hypothetical protein
MDYLTKCKDWVVSRFGERTSWDGVTIVVVCAMVLITGGLIKWVAWAGLAYGAYTLIKAE